MQDKNLKALVHQAFAETLRKFRKYHKAGSQERAALKADMDRSYWSALERGEHSVTIYMLFRIAAVLSVTPTKLMKETERHFWRLLIYDEAPKTKKPSRVRAINE